MRDSHYRFRRVMIVLLITMLVTTMFVLVDYRQSFESDVTPCISGRVTEVDGVYVTIQLDGFPVGVHRGTRVAVCR